MAIDLTKIRKRNEFRKPRDCDVIDGFKASQEIDALIAEVERLQFDKRELDDLRSDIEASNPNEAIYRSGNEARHQLGWSLLFDALEFRLIDTDGDDCPKPKEYGGAEELRKLIANEVRRLRSETPRWIPVTERLPEPHRKVLVASQWIGCGGATIREVGWTAAYPRCFCNRECGTITHWMPLPEPPK